VLPVAAGYDVVLCPFVLYAAAAALRLAGASRGERSRAAWAMPAVRSPASAGQGAIRQVNGGNTPRLRLSERGKGEGLAGGLRGPAPARREPRLKLGHGGPHGASSLGAAFASGGSRRGRGPGSGTMAGALGGGAAKVKFGTRRGEGMLGGAMALNSSLARSGLNPSRFGRSLLGGSVFSRSPSAMHPSTPSRRPASIGRSPFPGRSPSLGRTSAFGRSLTSRRTAGLFRSAPGGSATGGRAMGGSSLRGNSPGRGWLRQRSSLRGGTGGGWAGGRGPRLGAGPARLHMPRPRAKKRWRTGGYR